MKPVFEQDSRGKPIDEEMESPKLQLNIIRQGAYSSKKPSSQLNESFSSLEEDHPLNFIHPTEKVSTMNVTAATDRPTVGG